MDVDEEGLKQTAQTVIKLVGEANVLVAPTDVSKLDEVVRLKDKVYEAWGEVSFRLTPRLSFMSLTTSCNL